MIKRQTKEMANTRDEDHMPLRPKEEITTLDWQGANIKDTPKHPQNYKRAPPNHKEIQ